jgi:hypothetical protein
MRHTDAVRVALFAFAGAIALSSCATSNGDHPSGRPLHSRDLPVTVSTGIEAAKADMQVTNNPVAHYFADTDKVVYVSGGLYSSTCPPRGKATQTGTTITLTVENLNDNCTADAVRDTFQIRHVTSLPSRLVIEQAGQSDIQLNVSK